MFLVSSCSCLCPIHWSQVLSQEWRCRWSNADRRCSNYIWWSTSLLPTKVWLILEVWQYMLHSARLSMTIKGNLRHGYLMVCLQTIQMLVLIKMLTIFITPHLPEGRNRSSVSETCRSLHPSQLILTSEQQYFNQVYSDSRKPHLWAAQALIRCRKECSQMWELVRLN